MLIKFVYEVTLDGFECLVHAVEYQVIPVWRQAHELAEAAWVKLDQSESDKTVQQVITTAKFHVTRREKGWVGPLCL